MLNDLPPLTGRASDQSVRLQAASSRKLKSDSQDPFDRSKKVSSHLWNAQLTAQGIADGYFLERRAGIGKSEPTLKGYCFSSRKDDPGSVRLAPLTAKSAKTDYQSLMKALAEERRFGELKTYWSKLKTNFHDLYLALIHRDEEQKSNSTKQEIKRKQTD